MKKILLFVILSSIGICQSNAQVAYSCGTVDQSNRDNQTQYRNPNPEGRHTISSVQLVPDTIHVIVHVLWSTAAMNIHDTIIQNQLDILNEDFQRLNADTANTPAPFAAISGRIPIYFALAHVDSMGAPITGINRVQTTHGPFGFNTFFDMTHTANGGADKWNSHYLNMYCAEMSGSDGVGWMGSNILLISYQIFGLGRVGTHEMGHVFGLSHIWGPEQSTGPFVCSSGDGIADTPEQWEPIISNGPFPVFDSCTASGNGIMYMNYMNYNFDLWTNMFSQGQTDDMISTLNTTLNDLINGVQVGMDEFAFQNKISVYPNPNNGKFEISIPENENCKIRVIDALGKEVYSLEKSEQLSQQINLELGPGIYFCVVESESNSVVRKVIVE